MNKNFFTTKNLILSLKTIPIIRIAAMLIVAILSCKVSGYGAMIAAIIAVVALLTVQLVICNKYKYNEASFENSGNSILSYLPFCFLFAGFIFYSLWSGRDVMYSITISLALASLLLPRSKNYTEIVSYVVNKNGRNYSNGLNSCKIIQNCNKLILDDVNFIGYSKHITSISTIYSKYSADDLEYKDDYLINVLKEFTAILYSDSDEFKTFIGENKGDYDYQIRPENENGITYAVLNNKSGVRVVVSGDTDKIKSLCSDCADRNSLTKLSDDKHEIDNSITHITGDNVKILSFAFCDLDSFVNIDTIDNMIFAGSLEIRVELNKNTLDLCQEIKEAAYCTEIRCTEITESVVSDVLRASGLNNFVLTDGHAIVFNNHEVHAEDAVLADNKIIYKDNVYRTDNSSVSLTDIKNNALNILSKSYAIERNINIFSLSIIVTFLLASVLIPNNVMHPYIIILISCIIEIFSVTTLSYYKTNKQNGIKNLLNTFVVSLCALGLFFAGRFFVDVPLSKFDAVSVNTARMMLLAFFILTTAFYDSVAVFSEPLKHLKNILVMAVSVVIVILFNLPVLSNLLNFSQLSFEAFKHVILFVLIPVLLNAAEVIITIRKDTNDGK